MTDAEKNEIADKIVEELYKVGLNEGSIRDSENFDPNIFLALSQDLLAYWPSKEDWLSPFYYCHLYELAISRIKAFSKTGNKYYLLLAISALMARYNTDQPMDFCEMVGEPYKDPVNEREKELYERWISSREQGC